MFRSDLLILGSMLILVACGSSPPVRYFNLEPLDSEFNQDDPDSPVLGLGPLRIPDYLERQQIVRRSAGAEMIVDDYNRWAEPVDNAIYRTLVTNVDSELDDVICLSYPFSSTLAFQYQMGGRIDRFDVDQSGNAVLLVQWGIVDRDGNIFVSPRRVRYTAQASDPNNPSAIARSMSETLARFSEDIANSFEAALNAANESE